MVKTNDYVVDVIERFPYVVDFESFEVVVGYELSGEGSIVYGELVESDKLGNDVLNIDLCSIAENV